jgi:hypothetical protein
VTVPLPAPDAVPVTISQSALFDVAVQVQPDCVVRVIVPPPPPAVNICDVGAIEYEHVAAAAACVTVNVCPATVSVPVRAAPVFADALKATVPLPVPDAPAVTVIQSGLFEAAVHAQPAPAVTVIDPVPPAGSTAWVPGAMLNVHAGAAAACVTVRVWPPIVSVPVRAAPVFAAALNETVPLPLPDAPLVMVSQSALFETADHVQPPAVDTFTEPVPPAGSTLCVVDESENVQPEASVSVNVRPAIVSVPERDGPELAAAAKVTCPLPVPDPPLDSEIQFAFDAAVQEQPSAIVTETVPLPPPALII